MKTELNPFATGCSAGIISAVLMLILGIFGNLGFYLGAVNMMQQWHMFFSLSIGGIIAGMIEASVISFLVGYAFAFVYNKFS